MEVYCHNNIARISVDVGHLFGAPKHGLNPQKRNADLFEVVRTDCQMILGNVGKKKGNVAILAVLGNGTFNPFLF